MVKRHKSQKKLSEKAIAAARNTLKKDKRINLRLTQKDYHQIQIKAIEDGMPYQTLISSIGTFHTGPGYNRPQLMPGVK